MEAGKLDRWIDLQTYQGSTVNALNEAVKEWVTTTAKIPAQLASMSGSERVAAGQTVAAKTRVFVIRHRDDVAPGDDRAILFDGTRYDIIAVDPTEGRKVGLRITAIARAE